MQTFDAYFRHRMERSSVGHSYSIVLKTLRQIYSILLITLRQIYSTVLIILRPLEILQDTYTYKFSP